MCFNTNNIAYIIELTTISWGISLFLSFLYNSEKNVQIKSFFPHGYLFGNSNKQGLTIPSFFHHQHQALTSCPGKIITTLKPTNLFLFCQQETETLCHAPPEQAKVNLISVLNKPINNKRI